MLKHKIKELREAAGMNKAQLGRAVEVTDVTVGYWESGAIRNIGSDKLLKLAGVFGVSVSEMLEDPRKDKTGLEWAAARCRALQEQGFEHSRNDVLEKQFNNLLEDMKGGLPADEH